MDQRGGGAAETPVWANLLREICMRCGCWSWILSATSMLPKRRRPVAASSSGLHPSACHGLAACRGWAQQAIKGMFQPVPYKCNAFLSCGHLLQRRCKQISPRRRQKSPISWRMFKWVIWEMYFEKGCSSQMAGQSQHYILYKECWFTPENYPKGRSIKLRFDPLSNLRCFMYHHDTKCHKVRWVSLEWANS